MIAKPSVETLLKGADNRYELVIAISKRARQIVDGNEPMINTEETSNVTISSLEFEQKKYKINRQIV